MSLYNSFMHLLLLARIVEFRNVFSGDLLQCSDVVNVKWILNMKMIN